MASLREYVINAVAGAAAIGAGTSIISSAVTNARQDEQIRASAVILPEIQKDVRATREAVIRLEAKQEKSDVSRK